MKTNILYYVGRPEVYISGRFGRRSTRYATAIKGENGDIAFGGITVSTNGRAAIPKNVIHISRADFKKLVSEQDYKKLDK